MPCIRLVRDNRQTGTSAPSRAARSASRESSSSMPHQPARARKVAAASADNPLPDIAVRRINCAGGWVNLKNELPADRPVLIWFWAPH